MKSKIFRHYIINTLLICAVLIYGTAITSSCNCKLSGSCKCQPLSPDISEAPSCCCQDADHRSTPDRSEGSGKKSPNTCCKSIGCMIIHDKKTVIDHFRQNFVIRACSTASDIYLTLEVESNRPAINSAYIDTGQSHLCVFIC